jgi:hypothetical protein
MKYCLLYLFVHSYLSCRVNNHLNKDIRGVSVVYQWPLLHNDGSVTFFRDSFEFYHYSNVRIYRLPKLHEATFVGKAGEVKLHDKIEYDYFLFKEKDSTGILYSDTLFHSIKPVNEFIKMRGIKVNPNAIFSDNDSLLFVSGNIDKDFFYSIYVPKVKFDKSYNDTSVYYFINKNLVNDFSLNPQLDSIYKSKLYRIRLIYNSYYDTLIKREVDKREIEYFLSEAVLKYNPTYNNLYQDFKKRTATVIRSLQTS